MTQEQIPLKTTVNKMAIDLAMLNLKRLKITGVGHLVLQRD